MSLEGPEIPTQEAVNYILEPARVVQAEEGQQSVIFCLDVSGSMCVTQAVSGKFKIKGDKLKEMQELMKFSDGSDQFFNENRNSTYVSRLQCVQAAIESQVLNLQQTNPNVKVGLVTFNNEVTVIGDGTADTVTINGDRLNNYEYLLDNATACTQQTMNNSVGDTADNLMDKLYQLQETGPTALGPAALTSIAMAAQGLPGSSVTICTDGLANVGLGSIEGNEQEQAMDFYAKVAEYAKQHGVTVNIVSIVGEECDLETLSTLTSETGGTVQRLEADKLTEDFGNVLSSPVIASNVVLKVKLHKGLEFRNEDDDTLSQAGSLIDGDG